MHVFPGHENGEGSNTWDEHIQEVTKKLKGKNTIYENHSHFRRTNDKAAVKHNETNFD